MNEMDTQKLQEDLAYVFIGLEKFKVPKKFLFVLHIAPDTDCIACVFLGVLGFDTTMDNVKLAFVRPGKTYDEPVPEDTLVIHMDVGGLFDPKNWYFDHHDPDGALREFFPSAARALYNFFKKQFNTPLLTNFVGYIDEIDSGHTVESLALHQTAKQHQQETIQIVRTKINAQLENNGSNLRFTVSNLTGRPTEIPQLIAYYENLVDAKEIDEDTLVRRMFDVMHGWFLIEMKKINRTLQVDIDDPEATPNEKEFLNQIIPAVQESLNQTNYTYGSNLYIVASRPYTENWKLEKAKKQLKALHDSGKLSADELKNRFKELDRGVQLEEKTQRHINWLVKQQSIEFVTANGARCIYIKPEKNKSRHRKMRHYFRSHRYLREKYDILINHRLVDGEQTLCVTQIKNGIAELAKHGEIRGMQELYKLLLSLDPRLVEGVDIHLFQPSKFTLHFNNFNLSIGIKSILGAIERCIRLVSPLIEKEAVPTPTPVEATVLA